MSPWIDRSVRGPCESVNSGTTEPLGCSLSSSIHHNPWAGLESCAGALAQYENEMITECSDKIVMRTAHSLIQYCGVVLVGAGLHASITLCELYHPRNHLLNVDELLDNEVYGKRSDQLIEGALSSAPMHPLNSQAGSHRNPTMDSGV